MFSLCNNMSALPARSLSFQKNRVLARCCGPEQSGSTVPPDTPGARWNTRGPYFHPQQPRAWWRAKCILVIVYRNPSASDAGPPGGLVSLPLTSLDSLSPRTAGGGSLWGTVPRTAGSPCSAGLNPGSAVPATGPSAKTSQYEEGKRTITCIEEV